ncbi:MAG TPA: alkaline phosphatase family protein [Candidatus Dormibacteraeota bacterium]|nr:alkaline phosphatase family protein [Candidatus Dormibacteraeota bacterium]
MPSPSRTGALAGLAALTALSSCSATPTPATGGDLHKINHLVVIYQENWSFDSLYGLFPGANGIAGATVSQVDKTGAPITTQPQAIDNNGATPVPETAIPAGLPVKPYDISKYVPADKMTGDIVHRYYQEQYQIDGGKNDRFIAGSDNPGLVLSYYDASTMPEGKLAKEFTLSDNTFHSAFGGSFLNHQWLICACTPQWPADQKPVPQAKVTTLDASGLPVTDGFLTTDGKSIVNTSYTVNTPHPKSANPAQLIPLLTGNNIGDELTAKNVSWKWYSGGWDDALAGKPDPNFQYHHQPFNYYQTYADGTQAKADHLQDEIRLFTDLGHGTLPQVSFVKPLGPNNEHPGYANLIQGQNHVAEIVNAVRNSPYWKDTAIVITYDENGGRWDHVAPPKGDIWGPGVRVPLIVISPYAHHGYVDHTQYETVSILRFIEERWNVPALGTRDAAAKDLTNAFDFNQSVS